MKEWMRSLMTGEIEKRSITGYLLCILIFLFSILLISQILFPGGYSARENFISDHGSGELNPTGSWFFIIGIGMMGILLIPYLIFIFRRTWTVLRSVSLTALIGGILGSAGLSMVGIFPKGSGLDHLHNIGADLAWYCFLISMISTSAVIFYGIVGKRGGFDPVKFLIVEILVFISGISVFILTIPTLKQWTAFLTVLLWLIGIYFVLPERVKSRNPEK
ncbi:MAG: DUF998 domain-containing protein [Thermoplasmatota archaeon]